MIEYAIIFPTSVYTNVTELQHLLYLTACNDGSTYNCTQYGLNTEATGVCTDAAGKVISIYNQDIYKAALNQTGATDIAENITKLIPSHEYF